VRTRTVLLLGLLVPALLTSCAREPATDPSAAVVVVTHNGYGDGSGMDAIVRGKVAIGSDGCVHLDDKLVVWPKGTWWSVEDGVLVLPDGGRAALGTQVDGGGGYVPRGGLSNYVDDSQLLSRCAASDEVAVFNEGSTVTVAPSASTSP
jgi:hypothetical protein